MRDISFGKLPPTAVVNSLYITITVSTAIVISFLASLKKYADLFLKFDAIGLGVFTIIGSTFAYNIFGLNFLAMSVSGLLTAIGGGILRDVFVNEIPMVFVKEFYASASFVGVVTLFTMLSINVNLSLATIVALITTTSIRLVAVKFNWNLPKARS